MRDNVTLHIQAGATLLGSNQIEHYPEQKKTGTRIDWYLSRSLIYAQKTKNISITGEGLLNGNSKGENNFMSEERMQEYRHPEKQSQNPVQCTEDRYRLIRRRFSEYFN